MTDMSQMFTQAAVEEISKRYSPEEIEGFLTKLNHIVEGIARVGEQKWKNAEDSHKRAEKRAAIRVRRHWKKSDRAALETLDLNDVAQKRMATLSGTGRPVVKPHQPLLVGLSRKLRILEIFFKEDSRHEDRRKAFKQSPWYKFHVEALYQGEYELAREKRLREPSRSAEEAVGTVLGISSSTVHQICREVRRVPKEENGFPPIILIEFECWMRTGKTIHEQQEPK